MFAPVDAASPEGKRRDIAVGFDGCFDIKKRQIASYNMVSRLFAAARRQAEAATLQQRAAGELRAVR